MIYILSNDPAECARMLDDKSLGKMISKIAKVCCNVHHARLNKAASFVDNPPENITRKEAVMFHMEMLSNYLESDIPLRFTKVTEWERWTCECLANYNALLAYARACCEEWTYRKNTVIHRCPSRNNQEIAHLGTADQLECYSAQDRITHKHHDVIVWCESNKPELAIIGEIIPNIRAKPPYIKAQPWPLVMPEEYIVCSECNKTSHFDCDSYTGHQPDVIESYRAYYKAKLQKPCSKCRGLGNNCKVTKQFKFTRREIPAWLGDL